MNLRRQISSRSSAQRECAWSRAPRLWPCNKLATVFGLK